MNYPDGREIRLGDEVSLDMPDGWKEAQVVMLGSNRAHLEMDSRYLDWYLGEGLEDSEIVLEWLKEGVPLTGAYMSTQVRCCIKLLARAE